MCRFERFERPPAAPQRFCALTPPRFSSDLRWRDTGVSPRSTRVSVGSHGRELGGTLCITTKVKETCERIWSIGTILLDAAICLNRFDSSFSLGSVSSVNRDPSVLLDCFQTGGRVQTLDSGTRPRVMTQGR